MFRVCDVPGSRQGDVRCGDYGIAMPPATDTPSRPIVALTREVYGTLDVPGAEIRCAGPDRITRENLLSFVRGATVLITMYTDKVEIGRAHV